MADKIVLVFWLVPNNNKARAVLANKANSRFRQTLPQTAGVVLPPDSKEGLAVFFDSKRKKDILVTFGDKTVADIAVPTKSTTNLQAELFFNLESRDVHCRDSSSDESTAIEYSTRSRFTTRYDGYDFRDSELVKGNHVKGVAIYPRRDAILILGGAEFRFVFNRPWVNRDFLGIKNLPFPYDFIHDAVQEPDRSPSNEIEQLIQSLGDKPSEVFDQILKHTVHQDEQIVPFVTGVYNISSSFLRRECRTNMLDYSRQLMNPSISSVEFATAVARVFFKVNRFRIDATYIVEFLKTIKLMIPNDFSGLISSISNLAIDVDTNGHWEGRVVDSRIGRVSNDGLMKISREIAEYDWSAIEKERLRIAFQKIAAEMTGLKTLKIHLINWEQPRPFDKPDGVLKIHTHIFKSITPLVRSFIKQGKTVEVIKNGHNWLLERSPKYFSNRRQNITDWWGPVEESDSELTSTRRLAWLRKNDWTHLFGNALMMNWKDEVEAALMRQEFAGWDEK